MSHTSYQAPGAPFEGDADYVVVGSGAGGATIAVGLARGGARVALVEAGAWRDPQDYPNTAYGGFRDMMDAWGSLLARGRAFWPIVQGRTMGGTTVINSAIVVRTPADIFRLWEAEHGFGGDALAETVWGYQDELEAELSVSPTSDEALGGSNQRAIRGAQTLGIEGHVIRRNVKDCLGKGQCLQGCRSERKQSTNLNFIPEVMTRGGHVLSSAPVHKIRFEGSRAIGVEGHFVHPSTRQKGAAFVLRAKRGVIVAASCTHSPALLLRSGLKLPALGKYFQAHPGTGVFGVYDEPVDMSRGATQGWASVEYRETEGFKLETLSLPLELVASRLSGGGQQLMERIHRFPYLAMWVAAVRAETIGRVKINWFGQPVVHYSMTPRDMKRLRSGLHKVARVHVAAGAKKVIPGVYGLPYELAADDIDQIMSASLDPRHYVGILSHLFGGCVMGSDPQTAVCDPNGQVYRTEGLFISDASQIPTTLGVNPQHTIMALARHRAAELLNRE